MSFRLIGLGELSLYRGEPLKRIAVPRKALAVMAVLAASGKRGVTRERLTTLLWPEAGRPGATGRGALKQTIYELRQAVGTGDVITGASELTLNPEQISIDVAELDAAHAVGDWKRVASVYAGPFVDGFQLRGGESAEFDHWVDGCRARYARMHREAIEHLAAAAAARGDVDECVALWRRIVSQEPLNGRATLALLEALAAAGDNAGALTQYRIHEQLLRTQLDVAPEPVVTTFAHRIRASTVAGAAAWKENGADYDAAPGAAPVDGNVEVAAVRMTRPPLPRRARILAAAAAVALPTIVLAATTFMGERTRVVQTHALPERAALRVTIDPHVNRVYVDGGASFDAGLLVIDRYNKATRRLAAGAGVAVDPATHWYWSGDYGAREVVVRNGRTDTEIGRVAVPGCPHSFAIAGERVWVAQQCDDHISVIESRTRRAIRHIPVPTLTREEVGGAKGTGEIFVNRNTGVAYFWKDGIPHRIDPATWEMQETPTFDGPIIAINDVTNRLYVRVDGGLRVLDGESEKLVAEVRLSSTPGRAAVGFAGRRVYVTTEGGLTVLDGETHRVLFEISLGRNFTPDAIGIDAPRNLAYVAGNAGDGSRALKVVALSN